MPNNHLSENIIELYQKYAREWVALRGEWLFEKVWLDRMLALLPDQANVLDLGCGAGKPIAAYLIEQGCTITGVDSAEAMLMMARANFPEQTWLHADMRQLNLEQKFDAILAWDSFFHLTQDDQRQMFAQFASHAKSGTMLMFSSGPTHGEAIGELFGHALYHASLAPEEYRHLLAQYGFEVLKMVSEDPECTGHTVWLAKKLESL
ncbi:class I SAM-dependent DNA methyltransferase [Acinetobacter sp. ANC 4178]|uniref:class I SAM-dependent DNA methyltransferase n=1 Tax=Acinetobacter sp. ANC 4178 TaxID=2529839 RepID=UPI001040449A|nr:class I SAM-dependent methyltransferase [Acinetobacter sp. ANC 4178]TCB67669.1 class I SAM-dependent methyltransferase [Acinetobacter sp. ANC 4178]